MTKARGHWRGGGGGAGREENPRPNALADSPLDCWEKTVSSAGYFERLLEIWR